MSTFIGREQDLATVEKYFQDALQGKGTTLFITGEAGIGKTTFVNEFKARYIDVLNVAKSKKTPDIRFAAAQCSELIGKGESYAPFIEVISRFVADDKAFGSNKLAEVVREIGADWFELVPVIGKALALISKTVFKWQSTDDVREIAERKGNKEKLVQQYVQILKAMSEKHPLVVFLDDLHWADDSSIYLLFHLTREVQDHRILILGTYRPTDIQAVRGDKPHPLKDALGEMHRYGICKEIKLGYFTSAHISAYLDASFPQHGLEAAFVAYLYDLTEGNPLFVTEQVKLLQEIGKIAKIDGEWRLCGTLYDADMPVSTRVEETIKKRFDRLKDDFQETLEYASINGEQFDATVLAQMLQQDELAVLKKLQTLDRVYQFVSEQKTDVRPTRGTVYQFVHSLVQKALYGTLSDGIKFKLHAKAAEIIENLYPEQHEAFAEELAAHWERGRAYAKAAPYLLLAARKANRQAGYQEARNHAQRGLELLKMTGAKTSDQAMLRQQIELLIELAIAEEAIGEAKNSIDHAETAAKLVDMADDQSFQGEAFYQIGKLILENRATNIDRVWEMLEKSLSFKIIINDYESIVSVLEKMRESAGILGKGDVFIGRCHEIIRLNQQELHLNIHLLRLIGMMLSEQGKYQEAYQNILESLNIALKQEDPNVKVDLFGRLVEYAIRLQKFSLASEHYAQAKEIIDTINNLEIKEELLLKLGHMAWHLNKYDEAFAYWCLAREMAHNRGDLIAEIRILGVLRPNARAIGRFDDAIGYAMDRLAISQKLGMASSILDTVDGLGWIFRRQGNYVKAIEMHQQAANLARQYGRDRTLIQYLISCYTDLWLMGKFREAIKIGNEALYISQQTKDINQEFMCLTNLAVYHFLLGDTSNAFSLINQAKLLKQSLINKRIIDFLVMRHSQILKGLGYYKEAYVILESVAIEGLQWREWVEDIHVSLIDSSYCYLAFDEIEKAFERLHQVEEFFKKEVFMEAIAMLKDAYALVYLAQGDFDKATASVNEAIILFQKMNSFRLGEAYLTLSAIELAQQQPAAALQHAVEAANIFKPIEYYRYGETVLMQARTHFVVKDYSKMRECLQLATDEFGRIQQPHHLAEIKLLEAQTLYDESKNKERAIRIIHEAKVTFEELGLKRLEKEAIQIIETFK